MATELPSSRKCGERSKLRIIAVDEEFSDQPRGQQREKDATRAPRENARRRSESSGRNARNHAERSLQPRHFGTEISATGTTSVVPKFEDVGRVSARPRLRGRLSDDPPPTSVSPL